MAVTSSAPTVATVHPPCLHDLLSFDVYRKYLRTIPIMPNVPLVNPWQVWGRKADNSGWASKCCQDYPQAFGVLKKLYTSHQYSDIALVSRSVLFIEPGKRIWHGKGANAYVEFTPEFLGCWDRHQFEWCKRCRRPTTFEKYPITHRALRKAPVLSEDNPLRCYYCGARQSFAGDNNDR